MLLAALAALRQIFSKPFRLVFFKSLGVTVLLLALAWAGLDEFALSFATIERPWLHALAAFATGAGLLIALAFLVAPVSALVAGFFIDDLAEIVEKEIDPHGPKGCVLPASQAVLMSLRFALASAAVNLLALLLLLAPGVNLVAFLLANAYLFGREYFELAATRFWPVEETHRLRRRHRARLFLAGLVIAGFVAIPVLNLLTPLFGIAFMARVRLALARKSG